MRIHRKTITIPTELFTLLDNVATQNNLSASWVATQAIQMYLKNPLPITLSIPTRTLPQKPTDVRKNLNGTFSRVEGSDYITYLNGKEVRREAIAYTEEGPEMVGRVDGNVVSRIHSSELQKG